MKCEETERALLWDVVEVWNGLCCNASSWEGVEGLG